jgi:hypothetical protein
MSAAAAELHDQWWKGEEPAHFQFPDKAGKLKEWDGWLAVSDSTMMAESTHWTVLEVYWTAAGHYVLRTLGCSVIYHKHGSACNTGDTMPGQDMDEDLEPCPRCRPTAAYKSGEHDLTLFDVEVDIPTIKPAATPEDLILAMRTRNGVVGDLSYLSARVLKRLRALDPAVNRVLSKPERLS